MSNTNETNATTEGTAPTPERLRPTAPGWWWCRYPREHSSPEVAEVFADMLATSAAWNCEVPVTAPPLEWLAEVPPPDVCAAWAANGRPSAAVLEALGEYEAARRAIMGEAGDA